MKSNTNITVKIKLLLVGILLSVVSLLVVVSCGGGSSVGGLNDILVGNNGGSGGSTNINPISFDDLSNNEGATFIGLDDDSDDVDEGFDSLDDGLYLADDALPFNFSLFGNTFNAGSDIVFCTNGWFSFDTDIKDDNFFSFNPYDIYYVLFGDSDGPYDSFIAPFWTDLIMDAYSGCGVWYETVGSAPNRKFIVQYFASDYDNEDNKLVFQTILFEGTNDIQFTYAKMEDVDDNDYIGGDGSVDGSGSFIGLLAGSNNISNIRFSVYSFVFPSIPPISTQAYYVYFKYNSSRNNYDIYTGNVAIEDINNDLYDQEPAPNRTNLRANSNQNIKNKNRTPINFRYFYKTNTIQDFMNFVNRMRLNRTNR